MLSVTSFLSTSNIFLIGILLDPPPFIFTTAFSFWTGALGNIFPVLFQLKGFSIYSDQFLQNALYVIAPQNRCLIPWRLSLSGFRSVFVIATDKLEPLRLKVRFMSRDDRAICTISRMNFFNLKMLSLNFNFEVRYLGVSPAIYSQCNQCSKTILYVCALCSYLIIGGFDESHRQDNPTIDSSTPVQNDHSS